MFRFLLYTFINTAALLTLENHYLIQLPPNPKYNELYRKACHNCFEKQYAGSMREVLDNVANIEIDFYDSKIIGLGTGGRNNEWYVRHNGTGTNDNCCGTNGNNNLSTCLEDIASWSNSHPTHQVITVFLDKKQAWGDAGEGRHPIDLDKLILSKIPRSKIFTPSDLKGSFPTLRAAANNKAWPTINSIQSKFVFVLTGGQLGNTNRTQHQYVEQRGNEAIIFVAPDTDEPEDVLQTPEQFNDRTANWIVFYNIESGDETVAPLIYEKGYISRIYNAHEDDESYQKLIKPGTVHFIALYNYKESGFNGGKMIGEFFLSKNAGDDQILTPVSNPLHHHHKRGTDCEHHQWATSDTDGHHHHKRGDDCEHGQWATDDVAGHHHHKRGIDCEHGQWATDEQRNP